MKIHGLVSASVSSNSNSNVAAKAECLIGTRDKRVNNSPIQPRLNPAKKLSRNTAEPAGREFDASGKSYHNTSVWENRKSRKPFPGRKENEAFVLVVDDEEICRIVAQKILRKNGYKVLVAENGEKATQIFREHANSIALVILDLTMPEKDGCEIFKEIRQIDADVPIIICSAYYPEEIEIECTSFIRKPYSPGLLIEKVKSAIAKSRQDRAERRK